MENHAALTLDAFRKEARRVDVETASNELGVDLDMFELAQAIWIYPQGAFLEELKEGGFNLTIGRSQWESDNRAKLDAILWAEHYLIESTDSLSAENGTLDAFLRTLLQWEGENIDDESMDWGGIFGIHFSGMDADSPIPTKEAFDLFDEALAHGKALRADVKESENVNRAGARALIESAIGDARAAWPEMAEMHESESFPAAICAKLNRALAAMENVNRAAQVSGKIENTVDAGARIAVAILREWISPADLEKVKRGADPGDYCDSNIAFYGAYAAIHFDELDAGDESQAQWVNRVVFRALEIIRADEKESE